MSKRKKYQIAAWLLVSMVLLALLVSGGFVVMTSLGKMNLKKNATSQMPALSDALADENSMMEPDESWEEDWIRYKGKVYDYNENIMTFLCMGIDVNDQVADKVGKKGAGQADALFLLVLNPDTGQMSIIAIDRNTMTEVDVYDSAGNYKETQLGQIALAHGYGKGKEQSAENTVNAVSKMIFDLPIHGYCAINMGAIPDINDAVGGVDVTVLEDMAKVNKAFKEGNQLHLEGELAYWYVKYRDTSIEESARMRLNRQKQYLVAYVEQAKKAFKSDIMLPVKLFNKITEYMTTDLGVDEVTYLAQMASGLSFSEENLMMLPGSTDTTGKFDEFYLDEEQMKQTVVDLFYIPLDGIE